MVLTAFFWSGAFIAAKITAPYIPSCSVTFLRFGLATVLMFFIKAWTEKKGMEPVYKLKKQDVPKFLFTGIVGMVGYHVLFFAAMNYTTAINSSIIRAIDPIITVIIAFVFLHQKVPFKQVLGILLSLLGVVLTLTGGDLASLAGMDLNRGDLYMLVAVLSWSVYGLYSKNRCRGIPPVAITLYSFMVCAIVLIPFVLMEKPWEFLPEITLEAWLAVLFMVIFSSGFAYYTQQIAIKEIGPARAAIFVNLVPVFSTILAVLMLGEELQPVKILTGLLIIAGVFICQRAGEKAGEKTAEKTEAENKNGKEA